MARNVGDSRGDREGSYRTLARAQCLVLAAAKALEEKRHADAQNIESDHGNGEHEQVDGVSGRRNDGGDDEDNQDGVLKVMDEEPRSDDAEKRQESYQY